MPYSKAPIYTTYETKRLDLISDPQARYPSNSTIGTSILDLQLKNVIVELRPQGITRSPKYAIRGRPGLYPIATTQAAGVNRGIYNWQGSTICVIGNTVYLNGTSSLTLSTSIGTVGFCDYISPTNVAYMFMCDGTKAYLLSGAFAWTTITSATGLPSPHIASPVYLDGYVFLIKSGTQDIYNSNLGDPTTWTAGNFVSAEMYGDVLIALARNNQYIYAIGSQSIEYFYDAANPTGTPLARNATAVQQFGTPSMESVVQTENEVVLVGTTSNGAYTVWKIDGFTAKRIASPTIDEVISQAGAAGSSTFFGSVFRILGQKFYYLCLVSTASGFSSRSFVYSFDTEIWTEWFNYNMTSNFPCYYITGGNSTLGLLSSPITCDYASGQLYYLNSNYMLDSQSGVAAHPISSEIITEKYDFDTISRKTMHRLSLIGEPPDKTVNSRLTFTISWSDDDYSTWSSARNLIFNADLPSIFQLGNFRRRAFKITYTPPTATVSAGPLAFRLYGIEVDINKGIA